MPYDSEHLLEETVELVIVGGGFLFDPEGSMETIQSVQIHMLLFTLTGLDRLRLQTLVVACVSICNRDHKKVWPCGL